MNKISDKQILANGLMVLALSSYILIGYIFERSQSMPLLLAILPIIGIFFGIKKALSLKEILIWAAVIRLVLLFNTPTLSDDFYRYLWDGQSTLKGIHPFLARPYDLIQIKDLGFDKEVFSHLNSPFYYSVYPTVCQVFYAAAAWLSGGSIYVFVVIFKAILLLFEAGSIWLLYKILIHKNLNINNIYWYALNPLVLLEFSANAHNEAIMIFFVIGFFYLLVKNKLAYAATSLGLAAATKLFPLMLIPLTYKYLTFKKFILFSIISILSFVIIMLPILYNSLYIKHMLDSVQLYYSSFEFNAFFYYVFKNLSYAVFNSADLSQINNLLKVLVIIVLALLAFSKNTLEKKIYWAIFAYFIFSAVVHPWYIVVLVPLGIICKYKSALIWSILALFTYSAYSVIPYELNIWIIFIEYLILSFFVLEDINLFKSYFNRLKIKIGLMET